jgi:hypothetical protein
VTAAGWHRVSGSDLLLHLHVQPGARKTGIAGTHGGALKLRVASPPVDGAANAAVIGFVAGLFGVPRSRVVIENGAGARQKIVRIRGVSALPGTLHAYDV